MLPYAEDTTPSGSVCSNLDELQEGRGEYQERRVIEWGVGAPCHP